MSEHVFECKPFFPWERACVSLYSCFIYLYDARFYSVIHCPGVRGRSPTRSVPKPWGGGGLIFSPTDWQSGRNCSSFSNLKNHLNSFISAEKKKEKKGMLCVACMLRHVFTYFPFPLFSKYFSSCIRFLSSSLYSALRSRKLAPDLSISLSVRRIVPILCGKAATMLLPACVRVNFNKRPYLYTYIDSCTDGDFFWLNWIGGI